MKIATVGKGGSGKTTIAGTLARVFAGDSRRILAIDGDPNPNLALVLGMTPEEADGIDYIPASVMQRGAEVDGVIMMEPTMPHAEIMEKYAAHPAANVDLIVMGKPAHGSAGSGCMCASHRAVRGLIAELTAMRIRVAARAVRREVAIAPLVVAIDALHAAVTSGEREARAVAITDMEAGLEHLKRVTARHVDMMLVVAEPYYRSLEAAMRTCELAVELGIAHVKVVANKVRSDDDMGAIRGFCDKHGMQIIGSVPYDEAMMEAERQGRAPLDHAAGSPGVAAIREIAGRIDEIARTPPPAAGGGAAAGRNA